MKYSYYSGCRERVLTRDYNALCKFVHDNGYVAMELLENWFVDDPLFNTVDEAEKFKDILDANKLCVSCYSVYIDVYTEAEIAKEYLKKQIRIANAVGSPYFHHTIYPPLVCSDKSFEELLGSVKPTLCEIIRYAASYGFTVLYEPQGMYFNGDAFIDFIKELKNEDGCNDVGVCFDNGNSAFVDYPPYELLCKTLENVKHVHIKDYKYLSDDETANLYVTKSGKKMREVQYGHGDMRGIDCIRVLEKNGYSGFYSTELNLQDKQISADEAGCRAVAELKETFK